MKHFLCIAIVLLLSVCCLQAADVPALTELKGIVVDDDGKPVAGANVWAGNVWIGGFLDQESWQRTDENGRFALSVPSTQVNPWMTVYAVSPEKERLAQARPKLQEGVLEIPEVLLVLKQARIITGTVTDANGNPVEGALVGGCWDMPYPNVTKSDKDGNFRFAYPEDGARLHQVFAIHKERGMDFVETEEGRGVRAETPLEKIKDGPFSLKLAEWQTFKIRVVDEYQTPIPGVEVFSWLPRKDDASDSINLGSLPNRLFQIVTDVHGIAEVPSITERTRFNAISPSEGILMPDGSRRFFVGADERWVDFDKSEAIPTLVMARLGNVRGTVKRPDGTPVAWSRITISRHTGCGHGMQWTNTEGEFGITWGKAGELFDIGVESKLGAAPGVFGFNIGDGIEEKRLDFVLERGIRLHGTVYLPDGTPSEQYWILIQEKCPLILLEATQAALGDSDQTCPPGGCPVGRVIRQVSDDDELNSGGKYEYLLPAVHRKYDIRVSSYTNPDVSLILQDFEVKGDENEIRLDFHLQLRDNE